MNLHYILGVATAILCGISMQAGILMQKKAVNDMSPEEKTQRFLRTLIKHPRWLGGLLLEYGVGTVTFMAAQSLIGPALVPGFMASGLIVLAIGSVKIIGESLSLSEYAGIPLMIAGITLLGLSELEISVDVVRERLATSGTAGRIAILTISLFVLWGVTHLASLRQARRKGIIMAFSNGFPFAISNLWVNPLLAVFIVVMTGNGSLKQTGLFVLASVILVGVNVFGVLQTNEAFKFAQASNIIPVQQLPVQITPVLFYFYVYALQPPKTISGVLIIAGVALIILASFLLGRRQSELEKIK
jgi:multidrug transporter EmrE-like cation transporter